jgi:hypothetical protein
MHVTRVGRIYHDLRAAPRAGRPLEIRLERPFGTDDLCDAAAVGLPLTPRPEENGPRLWVARLPALEASRHLSSGCISDEHTLEDRTLNPSSTLEPSRS